MLSIKYSGILIISVSENFLAESGWFFLQHKICHFLKQGICIYVGRSIYELQLISFFYSSSFEYGTGV
jgi:hypothetical protein